MAILTETVKTEAFSMDFFRFGKGDKALVILPGLSIQSVMRAADQIAEAYNCLTEDFTVYLFERRKELPAVYSIKDMAEDTATVIRQLGLHDIYLFGASQGGMIAMQLAILYPELVCKMVLGSTVAAVPSDGNSTADRWIRLAQEKNTAGLYLDFAEKIYPPDLFVQYWDILNSAAETVTDEELERFVILANSLNGFNLLSRLGSIDCPVLYINAKDDAVFDTETQAKTIELLQFLPNFCVYTYDGYGHAAFDTAPDYKERVRDFFLSR